MKKKDIKVNDVFLVSWKGESERDRNWCFEGILVALKEDGDLVFCDTYWGIGRNDEYTKSYTFSQMIKNFRVRYYCNLNELEKIDNYDADFYEEKDVFTLSNQHACYDSCIFNFIKKGTKRSKNKMKSLIYEKISKTKREIEWKIEDIVRLNENIKDIEAGKTDIYINK